VYHAAREREAADRPALLDEACGGDLALRQEVESLLGCEAEAAHFLETPLVDARQTGADPPIAVPKSASHFPRFLLIVWLLAALALASFGYAGWLLLAHRGATTEFGWSQVRRGDGWFVSKVAAGGPAAGALLPGDRIVSFDGRPPRPRGGTALQRRDVRAADTYRLIIERPGGRQEVVLSTRAGPSRLGTQLVWFVVSLVWCAVGLFTGAARPDRTAARLACAAAVATGLVFLQVGIIQRTPLWQPLHLVLGAHFFLLFPRDEPVRGAWRASLWLFYLTGGASALILHWLRWGPSIAPHLVVMPGTSATAVEGLGLFAGGGALMVMIAAIPRNYRRLADEDQRRRVRWVVAGSVVGLAPQFWWWAIAVLDTTVGPTSVSRQSVFVNAATVTIPISVAYAVLKHRVFGIRVAIRLGLQHLLARRALQALVAVPLVALGYVAFTDRHRTVAELMVLNSGYLYWIAAAGLALRFRRPVRVWLDRHFFREQYDREQGLLELVDDMAGVESMPELSRTVTAHLERAFHPRAVHLWYRERDDFALGHSSDPFVRRSEFPSGGPLVARLESDRALLDAPFTDRRGFDPDEAAWLMDLGARIVVPINDSAERLVGVLLLGEKQSEAPYSASDRRLLQAIARHAAAMRETLQLRRQVGEDQRIRRDVLARLEGAVPGVLRECPACGACFAGPHETCDTDGQPLAPSLPVPRTIDGKYRLDRLIARGGMGAVYQAHDLRLDRPVAVKIMMGRAFGQPSAIRRFHREARASARLNHPNIVTLYDFGMLEGEAAYLVMERLPGTTLRVELDRSGHLTPAGAAEWFEPLLEGVAAAHERGIVHRDLKPENVMGHRHVAGRLQVKVLDFGLAKMTALEANASASVTAGGFVLGTIGYMPPEQLLGRDTDHRADVFALGVMLIEALTGRRPFDPHSPGAMLYGLPGDVPVLAGSSPEWVAVRDLVRACVSRDPAARPGDLATLRRALIPALRTCPPLDAAIF
jgi:eukaryotic-like serine/threonine-protein kinase